MLKFLTILFKTLFIMSSSYFQVLIKFKVLRNCENLIYSLK
jgi:hypothetical protein